MTVDGGGDGAMPFDRLLATPPTAALVAALYAEPPCDGVVVA